MTVVKVKKEYFSIIFILICLVVLFRYPDESKNGVIKGIEICLYTIIPSLFPFMTLSTYTVKSNILSPFYKLLSGTSKAFFKQPPCAISVIILSMIGGFPVGIKMANDLYMQGQITNEQAQRLCLFCMNGGPAFVITTVGLSMLGSMKAGIIIYVSLCISAFVSGVISSFVADKKDFSKNEKSDISLPLSSLSVAISDSMQSIITICAWVILFSSATSCLKSVGLSEKAYLVVCSLLEVTNGCILLSGKASIPVIAGIIGFGGLCVHFQVLSFLKNTGMKYGYFLVSRVLNGTLSAIFTQLFLLFVPIETDVFSNFDKNTVYSFSVSFPAFFVVIIMCIIMILDIDRKKKVC